MESFWNDLLIRNFQDEISEAINKKEQLIIKGTTGCGKSTYIPYFLFNQKDLKNKRIALIQPRRVAVKSIYYTLKKFIDKVSYKVRFDKIINHKKEDKAYIQIFSDGMFLNEIIYNSINFDFIIIDEVHERSVRTDLLISLLPQLIKSTSCKLILMSATVNINLIQKFLNANLVNISGMKYGRTVYYENEPVNDYIYACYKRIKDICMLQSKFESLIEEYGKAGQIDVNSYFNRNSNLVVERNIIQMVSKFEIMGTVIVFLPGEEDIHELYKLLKKHPELNIVKIYGKLDSSNYDNIYKSQDTKRIKVILSTNICETSLTIPNTKYVIDTGLHKEKVFHNTINYLIQKETYKENATQRAGRCNRLSYGYTFRLYTKDFFYKMKSSPLHETKEDPSFIILTLLSLKQNIFDFKYLRKPTHNSFENSLKFLLDNKCISYKESNNEIDKILGDSYNLSITKFGTCVLSNPVDVHLSIFLEKCRSENIYELGAGIVSYANNYNINNIYMDEETKKDDFMNLLQMLDDFNKIEDRKKYCFENNINFLSMVSINNTFLQLCKDYDLAKFKESISKKYNLLIKTFCNAFKYNTAKRTRNNEYYIEKNQEKVFLHPKSIVFMMNCNRIVFIDVFFSNKKYVRFPHACTE